MKRRRFLVSSGIALGGAVGTAGCSGSGSGSPPREAAVFQRIAVRNDRVVATLEQQPVIQSRKEMPTDLERPAEGIFAGVLAGRSPVGVARGAQQGTNSDPRGLGNADAAPEGRNGRAKWRGGNYSDWWDKHGNQVDEYEVSVVGGGFYYYGSTEAFRQKLPGPGPLDWQQPYNGVQGRRLVWDTNVREGWYRVGAQLEKGSTSFGWECVDFRVEATGTPTPAGNETTSTATEPSFEVTTQWKVSPSL